MSFATSIASETKLADKKNKYNYFYKISQTFQPSYLHFWHNQSNKMLLVER